MRHSFNDEAETVQNSNQAKIAILCIFLFSKTLFAADSWPLRPSRSSDSVFPDSDLSSGALPAIRKPSGIPPRTVGPDFGEKPFPSRTWRTNPPRTVLPDFGGGLDNNKKPRISGTFGTPEAELIDGNLSNAKASCIQDAIQGGENIPNLDDSSVWEFATKSSSIVMPISRPSSAVTALQSKLMGSSHTAAAFAKSSSCDNDLQHSACVSLLSKASTEVTQAYYNSALKKDLSIWDEVSSFLGLIPLDRENDEHVDIVTALKKARDKENRGTGGTASIDLSSIENQDPLLVATQLLIQGIDESLARGDKDGADKAEKILKKINPSAAYAVSCVLGSVKLGGLNEDLDQAGQPQGSYFGPLSGIDYGKVDELKIHGFFGVDDIALITLVLTGITLISYEIHHYIDSKKADAKDKKDDARAARAEKIAEKTLLTQRIKDYMACKGPTCAGLYPDAAAVVKAATPPPAAPSQGSTPTRKDPDTLRIPVMTITAPLPGSGGNAGELRPFDPTPSGSDLSDKIKKEKDWDKHRDPEASERFCQKTVNDYKAFAIKKVTDSGRPVEILSAISDNPIPSGSFGIAQFDKWTSAYWAEQKRNRESDPEYQAKQNNCHAMDEAQGL